MLNKTLQLYTGLPKNLKFDNLSKKTLKYLNSENLQFRLKNLEFDRLKKKS